MDKKREDLYRDLFAKASNSSLKLYQGAVPNGNKVWIKMECELPWGSHYDRVYPRLFYGLEQRGLLIPGQTKVMETTSGSAGVSFAGVGKELGYECLVAIPEGGEKAREDAIKEQDAELIFTSKDDYIAGFPAFVKGFVRDRANKGTVFLNHSMGPRDRQTGLFTNNENALGAIEKIADEVVAQTQPDIFVPAIGNGTSVLGVARRFNALGSNVRTIGFETFQSAATYDLLYPGQYYKQFGIRPGTLPRHRLPGTSFPGIDFPHIRNSVESGLMSDVVLVSDRDTDDHLSEADGALQVEFVRNSLPRWDDDIPNVDGFGRSTLAGLAVALNIAKNVDHQNLLILGYDSANRYDNPSP